MVARPPLPLRSANPHIKDHLNAPSLPPVKYQILHCQGKEILVGRLKIETPTESGHAFILRRFDTGAVSLTTMFRAAFPNASDYEEKVEIQWVKEHHDLSGNNGSTKDTHITRLAGTWVSPQLALELGKAYSLGKIINSVVEAVPDPTASYRRSGKAAAAANAANTNATPAVPPPVTATTTATITETVTAATKVEVVKPPSASKSLPTPSPTAANPPAKRRKESSPAPSLSQSSKPPSRASPSPVKAAPHRRSARTKSPAPRPLVPLTSVTRTPKAPRSAKKDPVASTSHTPGGTELTTVEEENQLVEDGVAGSQLHDEDIREQQKLIKDLKAKRDAAKAAVLAEEEEEDMDVGEDPSGRKKREREEEKPLQFDFKQPRPEGEERAIATNRRVSRFHLEPRTKSFAWGVAAFAVGMGAVTFLPNFF